METGNCGSYNGDSPLISRDDGTTNLFRSNFGHVHNDDGGNKTDTKTSDNTTTNQETDGSRGDLKNNTTREDDTSRHDGPATSNPVRKGTTEESTEEGSGRKNRSN